MKMGHFIILSLGTMLPLISPTYHSCALTLAHYVLSVRFVSGVICMETEGQRHLAIFHIYGLA